MKKFFLFVFVVFLVKKQLFAIWTVPTNIFFIIYCWWSLLKWNYFKSPFFICLYSENLIKNLRVSYLLYSVLILRIHTYICTYIHKNSLWKIKNFWNYFKKNAFATIIGKSGFTWDFKILYVDIQIWCTPIWEYVEHAIYTKIEKYLI